MSIFKTLRMPIGLAPMAGVIDAEMAAKACQSGILGSLGAGMMTPEAIRNSVTELRKKAPNKPFNLNLFVVDDSPQFTAHVKEDTLNWVSTYSQRHNYLDLNLLDGFKAPYAPKFLDQFEQALQLRPPVISFTFGIVSPDHIARCQSLGIEVWGTATTIEEALQWQKNGADAIILQGAEAGGHRGSFTTGDEPAAIPLRDLFIAAQQNDILIPVIVAGGIMDGQEAAHYIRNGAAGVQFGTLLMGATDSSASEGVKRALSGELGTKTTLTKAFTGRWARGIENEFSKFGENQTTLPYPAQNRLTQPLRALAGKRGDINSASLWAGANFSQCRNKTISEIIDELESEFNGN